MAASVDDKCGRRVIAGRSVRWDQGRADAYHAGGWWVRETLADALARVAAQTPARILVVDGEERVDAKTMLGRARCLAAALLERAPSGSVISFMLPNWHEAAVIYLAATIAGMVVHPVLPSLRDHDLRFMLRDVGSRMIFIPESHRGHDYSAMLARVAGEPGAKLEVIVVRGDAGPHKAYAGLLEREPLRDAPSIDADAVRMALYTSGTTGSPKGVLHSHNSIHALMRQIKEHWRVEHGDAFLVPSPVSHIGGSIYTFEGPLLLGTTAVLMDRWDADTALHLAAKERCTHIAGATPFLEGLLGAARRGGERLPCLKVFICGGASVPPSLIRDASAHFENAAVSRVYGSTEVPVTTVGAFGSGGRDLAADTDGRIGIAEVKLAGIAGAAGGEGEILARGPQMLVGYLHPEDEAAVFDGDGFYRTGDIGRFAEGGCLVVTGRAKDIIIRNGENISPKEIEDVLITHPDIAEIAIVGLPDGRTGERACAVIVPHQGRSPDVAGLAGFLAQKRIAAFKFPEQVAIWESLPKNDAGKVLKHKIRAILGG